jgi:hypothetical protein
LIRFAATLSIVCVQAMLLAGCGSPANTLASGDLTKTFQQASEKKTRGLRTYSPTEKPNVELQALNKSLAAAETSNNWTQVEQQSLRMLQIRDEWLGQSSADSAESAARVSRALRMQGKNDEALRLTTERLGVLQNAEPQEAASAMVVLMHEQSLVYHALKRDQEAFKSMDNAITVRKNLPENLKLIPTVAAMEAEKKQLVQSLGGRN